MLTDFQNSFAVRLISKFATNALLNTPLLLKCVATLPCEIRMSENSRQSEICIVINDKPQRSGHCLELEGPHMWNSLPVQLRNPDITYGLFRRQLKGHLFREARTRRSVTSDMRRRKKSLTYLLRGKKS